MKFEKLQPGMTVYAVGRHKMGNTTQITTAFWTVRVLEVDAERRRVVASWNTNPPRTFYERDVAKWREKAPMLVDTKGGGKRLATREEQKAARAAVLR